MYACGVTEPRKPSPVWFEPLVTDKQGRFRVEGLRPGTYALRANPNRPANPERVVSLADLEKPAPADSLAIAKRCSANMKHDPAPLPRTSLLLTLHCEFSFGRLQWRSRNSEPIAKSIERVFFVSALRLVKVAPPTMLVNKSRLGYAP